MHRCYAVWTTWKKLVFEAPTRFFTNEIEMSFRCITTSRVKEGNPAVRDPRSRGSRGLGCRKTSPVGVRSSISLLRWRGARLPRAAISNEVIIDSIFLYAPSSIHLKLATKASWLSSRCRIFRRFTYKGVWAAGVGREPCDGQSCRMQLSLETTELPLWKHFTPFFHLLLIKRWS